MGTDVEDVFPFSSPERLKVAVKVKGAELDELKRELYQLAQLLGLAERLQVRWIPGGKDDLSGEVVGSTIYVYEKELPKALETLKHEIIEYLLVKHHEEDYVTMINALVDVFNRVMRKRREELVERLSKIV